MINPEDLCRQSENYIDMYKLCTGFLEKTYKLSMEMKKDDTKLACTSCLCFIYCFLPIDEFEQRIQKSVVYVDNKIRDLFIHSLIVSSILFSKKYLYETDRLFTLNDILIRVDNIDFTFTLPFLQQGTLFIKKKIELFHQKDCEEYIEDAIQVEKVSQDNIFELFRLPITYSLSSKEINKTLRGSK